MSMQQKIESLLIRFAEVEELLSQAAVASDQKKYRSLAQEHAYLSEVKGSWERLNELKRQFSDNKQMLQEESDPLFLEAIKDELTKLEPEIIVLEQNIMTLLVPPDPHDHRNTIIELRAGTGGDEAALFVGDCARMYKCYADKMKWNYELLSCSPSDLGGYREYIMVLSGQNVYRYMQYEAGTHRVQRVPETEAQGRVHTSAITVAALLEPDEEEDYPIDEKDLRIDTQRASGAGGQHVNTTDSSVRITHLPTGIFVLCQQERSQHKNKDKAMRLLKAKLIEMDRQKKHQELSSLRLSQVGSGDRSERIRTYNFPQNRLTDHRINLTKYNLDQVMDGELEDISKALVSFFYQERLEQSNTPTSAA
jgi:peptide chain release factor 1